MKKIILLAVGCGFTVAAAGFAGAQTENYPAKPVRLIAPFPPGGSVDTVARLIGARLAEGLGQQVIIDNRSGASGNIGTELAARAAPDGYTLLINTLPFVTNGFLYSRVPYDVVNDFAPIALLSSSPSMLAVHPSVPAHSVRELLQLAKSRPGTLNYGAAGVGTNPHIAGELFNLLGKVNIVVVQFKGGGPALIATIGGEIGVSISGVGETAPYVEAKRLRALGVTGLKRFAAMPDVPTIAEAGVPGYEYHLARAARAQSHAARDRGVAQRQGAAGHARAGLRAAVRAKRLRGHRQLARRARGSSEERAGEMGQGHQGKRHARRLTAPGRKREA